MAYEHDGWVAFTHILITSEAIAFLDNRWSSYSEFITIYHLLNVKAEEYSECDANTRRRMLDQKPPKDV